MSLELKQHLKLSQQLVMTPQLQLAIKLLQLSRMELEETVREEMMSNPLLEEAPETVDAESKELAHADARLVETEGKEPQAPPEPVKTEQVKGEDGANEFDWAGYLEDDQPRTGPGAGVRSDSEEMPGVEQTLTKREGLFEHLAWQLRMIPMNAAEERIATLIIGNLDADGYFKLENVEGDPLIQLAQEADVELPLADRMLHHIQEMDPVGVASRDLEECLLVQARHLHAQGALDGKSYELVCAIVRRFLKQVESRNYPAIARELGVEMAAVNAAVDVISNMEPKPGRQYSDEEPQYITPDVYVHKVGDRHVCVLNDDGLSKLRVSNLYRATLKNGEAAAGAKDYIRDKLRSAVWLIRSIHQRQRTILKVTESIVKFQREFLDKGVQHLRPLILRDVAEDIGMHESTVSRVTSNKYVHTPQGIYELKFFFNSGINRVGGDEIASEAVKNKIKLIVSAEDPMHPLSDQRIVEILHEQGIEIARRTVAKYREILGILPSSKRRRYT
jgi:RNA polymerase sigma-54 factor